MTDDIGKLVRATAALESKARERSAAQAAFVSEVKAMRGHDRGWYDENISDIAAGKCAAEYRTPAIRKAAAEYCMADHCVREAASDWENMVIDHVFRRLHHVTWHRETQITPGHNRCRGVGFDEEDNHHVFTTMLIETGKHTPLGGISIKVAWDIHGGSIRKQVTALVRWFTKCLREQGTE